jgi:para-nitrobenzyl esterase
MPYDVFAAGRQSDVPILVGSNAEEARALSDVRGVTASVVVSWKAEAAAPAP